MPRTWALGDIHANAQALRVALGHVDAAPADQLVILGDLLSYGPSPNEVLECVVERAAQGAVVLLGNHDELYLDLLQGKTDYYDRMPSWIRASVDWTLEVLDASLLRELHFVHEHLDDGVLYAHANPWGDWRYLNSDEDHREAAATLQQRWIKVGVFGHTHRSRIVEMPGGEGLGDDERRVARWASGDEEDVLILNAGAVGQPRNRRAVSTMLELDGTVSGCSVRIQDVAYDVRRHLAGIAALPLPEETRDRLSRFFHPRGD